jgi:hypothetical protein
MFTILNAKRKVVALGRMNVYGVVVGAIPAPLKLLNIPLWRRKQSSILIFVSLDAYNALKGTNFGVK